MKLLIGILYTIENEFPQCIEAIESQTYQNFDYFVIENLPNKEAHDTLYQRFMDGAKEYDLFIKIDADMVLTRITFFEEVVSKIKQNPEIDLLEIAVEDFFTNRLIFGLNIFRNTITWNLNSNEMVFVDHITFAKNHIHDKTDLAPAAYHCPNPSRFQAFHFGLHKAIKVLQNGSYHFRTNSSIVHWDNIVRLRNHLLETKNKKLAYSFLGVYLTFRCRLTPEYVDYNNTITKGIFEKNRKKVKKMLWIARLSKYIPDILLYAILVTKHSTAIRKPKKISFFFDALLKNPLKQFRNLEIQ